jgi:hypothetical protein
MPPVGKSKAGNGEGEVGRESGLKLLSNKTLESENGQISWKI